MQEGEPPWVCERGDTYLPTMVPGYPPLVYIHHPTTLGTPAGHTHHRWSTAESPLTALEHAVAERKVRKEGLTVSPGYLPVSLLDVADR